MAKIFVRPTAETEKVRDWLGRVIPAEGNSICDSVYIKRLIRDGSL